MLRNNQLLITIAIVAVGVLTRTVLHVAPNFEFVTALTLLAAIKLKAPYSFAAPALLIVLSDTIIGNSSIFLFTWSGFALTWVLGKFAGKTDFVAPEVLKMTGIGIVSILAFYLWTNLGVVFLSNMYPLSIAGYGQSLIMALPFLKIQLLSAIITVPIVLLAYEVIGHQLSAFGFQLKGSRV